MKFSFRSTKQLGTTLRECDWTRLGRERLHTRRGRSLVGTAIFLLSASQMSASLACGKSDPQSAVFDDAGPSTNCDVQGDEVLAVQCSGDPTPNVSCSSSRITTDGSVAEGCTVFLHDPPASTCGGQPSNADASCCVDTCICSGGICSTGF